MSGASGTLVLLTIVIGTVIQDVVADAMSTEVVARVNDDGSPRPDADIRAELGMVQVLGRLALSAGILAVAGVSGWVARFMSREEVFLIGLIVPLISITGAFIRRKTPAERRALDWRILGGGLAFGATVIALALGGVGGAVVTDCLGVHAQNQSVNAAHDQSLASAAALLALVHLCLFRYRLGGCPCYG